MFTLQPNLVVESRVHPSLHSNCHHQIVFAKLNLMICYPRPYSGIIQKLILTLSEEQFVTLIGKKVSLTLLLPKTLYLKLKKLSIKQS